VPVLIIAEVKAETSRKIPQKLAAGLKFVLLSYRLMSLSGFGLPFTV